MHMFFNRSHKSIFSSKNTKIIKSSKYKFTLLSKNCTNLIQAQTLACSVRPINVYTKRGLRASRQLVFKRKGKSNVTI